MYRNNSIKIIGSVEEIRSEKNSRVQVLTYKKNGEYITDKASLIREFQPHGFVFAYNINKFKPGTLIELEVVQGESSSNHDQYTADGKSKVWPTGHRLLQMNEVVLHSIQSVNINQLQQEMYRYEDLKDFFIQVNHFVYGPFDYIDGVVSVVADPGFCEVDKTLQLSSTNYTYLAKRPLVTKIDALNSDQLATWFRNKIKNLKIDVDVEGLKTIIEHQTLSELDRSRLNRAFKLLDEFHFTKDELLNFCQTSSDLRDKFDSFLAKERGELLGPLKIEEEILERMIEAGQDELAVSNELLNEAKERLVALQNDIEILNLNRQKIIEDIRIQSMLNETSRYSKYDISVVEGSSIYRDFTDFLHELCKSLQWKDESLDKSTATAVCQLSQYHCILATQVEFIMHIANCTGNCKIYLQQVEPDWIKFDFLYENGLHEIWQSALKYPARIHFLILEDFNLASFECYSKPLTDVLAGRRQALPGFQPGIPNNLWIFFIPIENTSNYEFGLPLISNSYQQFGGFPRMPSIGMPEEKLRPSLRVEDLKNHFYPCERSLEHYFSAND